MGSAVYLLDGGFNMDSYIYSPAPFPNPDATEEFRVATNNYDVRYGFASSAVVNIVTKSGSNTWHGNAFEFLRNDKLNASNFFSHEVDPLKRNQFGGSIGGRIIRDKLFIFGNTQVTTERAAYTGSSAYVPTNAQLSGDFSNLLPDIQLMDANTGLPFPGNILDPGTFNPISMKILESISRTDSPDGLVYLPPGVDKNTFKEFTIRADYYPTTGHQVSFRTFFDDFNSPGFDGNGNLLLASMSMTTRYQSHTLNWTWSPKSNLTNHLVVAYGKMNVTSIANMVGADGQPACFACYGMKVPDYPEFPPVIGGLGVGGYFSMGQNTNYVPRWTFEVSDSATWVKGKHLIVAGVDVVKQDMSEWADYLARPLVSFSGQVSGDGLADFMLGQMSSFAQSGSESTHPTSILWAGYVGDTFRLTPNFTLDLGLRWGPFLPPQVEGDRMTLFRPGLQSTRYPNAPLGMVFPGDPGVPLGAFNNQYKNFEPRLGIAWQPKALPHTAIRAGFGIFISPNMLNDYPHAADGAPFSPQFNLVPGGDQGPYIDFTDPYKNFAGSGGVSPFPPYADPGAVPPSSTEFILPTSILGTFNGDFVLGKNQAWNFSVEHEFGSNFLVRVAYVGRESWHMQTLVELNPGIYADGGARTRYPDYGRILSNVSWGTASYNALQMTVEKRFSHGLQFTSNYTYSKSLDSQSKATTAYAGSVGNPFDLRWNRGRSDMYFPSVWSNHWVFQLPGLARYGKVVAGVFGNWEVSGVWQLMSGKPFNVFGGQGNNRSLAQIGGDRADLTGEPLNVHTGNKDHWLSAYVDRAAFKRNEPGTFGNAPRNMISGPGTNNADLGISKNIPFKERYKIQVRWEMFNAFNRTQFNNPGTNWSSSSFGRITSSGAARVMQIGAKLSW
ncbi:MAG: hypothetical protein MUP80_13280 [Acidobacteriia bacterium]|nr:hypothetical protein [Terriglobia bacterium]